MLINFLKYVYRRPQHLVIQILARLCAHSLELDNMHNVLIISPHPDDEVFGCGNLMKELCQRRIRVTLLILSKGEGIANTCNLLPEEVITARQRLAKQANSILGMNITDIKFLDFLDGRFAETDNGEVAKLEKIIKTVKPDTIFYPHPYDGSPDHIIASDIITRLTDQLPISRYHYCVWLWHHMPLYKAFLLSYKKSCLLQVYGCEKKQAVSIYAQTTDENGIYYSGKLPKMLLKAIDWKYELYFKD